MIQMLYTGRSGLTGQQKNIDVISNNVANVETDGYKATRFDFQDALYARLRAPHPASNGPEKNLQRGSGVLEYQTARLLRNGGLYDTGYGLDFALEGRGFFVVENPLDLEDEDVEADQTVLMVRSGSFHLSAEEDGDFIVDQHSRYVLDADGERIALPEGVTADMLSCDTFGMLTCFDPEGEVIEIAQLQIVDFVNPMGLSDVGNGAFMQTDNAGELLEAVTGKVVHRKLEGSNVDYAEEMTRLIRAQRAYQLASRVVTTADQMMGVANSIRG